MPEKSEIESALQRAVHFLDQSLRPSGELPVYASTNPTLLTRAEIDPSIFPSALAAQSLSSWPPAHPVRDRICQFLAAEMDEHGLWRHWPRSHPHHASLPPDLDDSSCASVALAAAGRPVPDNRPLFLANRNGSGLFFTWFSPRLRWSGARHMVLTCRQLAHLPTLILFFRKTSAAPGDVDAVVNANALFHLSRFDGDGKVIEFLLSALREGRERQCDKWYDDPFVIWYFLARVLAGRSQEGAGLIVGKLRSTEPSNALQAALALSAALACEQSPDEAAVQRLLALQLPDGSWPRAALYHGGRARLRSGFAEPHPDTPRWGSEAVTTAFAVEALARYAQQPT